MAQATASAAVAAPAPATQEQSPKYANFRDFNSVALEARITHVKIVPGQYGEYAAVTAVTNLKDGVEGVAVQFTSNAGILKLAKAGHLMAGRRVHLTGTLAGFASSYEKDGQLVPLQRPRMQLTGVQLKLGAKPRSAMQASA